MLSASLRRSGGSLILTIPQSYVEQNHLEAGSKLALEIAGQELRIKPARTRSSLAELLAATPDGCTPVTSSRGVRSTGGLRMAGFPFPLTNNPRIEAGPPAYQSAAAVSLRRSANPSA